MVDGVENFGWPTTWDRLGGLWEALGGWVYIQEYWVSSPRLYNVPEGLDAYVAQMGVQEFGA